mmetsp:Transcript_46263/g.144707  ORF Transcript_46263/g.144707 Transcript_46263/m.144707 type:complete len:266 (+) Transcript_46263:3052-3849(+)
MAPWCLRRPRPSTSRSPTAMTREAVTTSRVLLLLRNFGPSLPASDPGIGSTDIIVAKSLQASRTRSQLLMMMTCWSDSLALSTTAWPRQSTRTFTWVPMFACTGALVEYCSSLGLGLRLWSGLPRCCSATIISDASNAFEASTRMASMSFAHTSSSFCSTRMRPSRGCPPGSARPKSTDSSMHRTSVSSPCARFCVSAEPTRSDGDTPASDARPVKISRMAATRRASTASRSESSVGAALESGPTLTVTASVVWSTRIDQPRRAA